MKKFMNNAGFTLVELIVVIAILGILAAVAVPAYSGYITKANDAAVVTELDAIKTAAQAANATAGEIGSITVNAAGNAVTINATGNNVSLAGSFAADFATYYDGETAAPTVTAATASTAGKAEVSITAISKIGQSSYKDKGATWTAADGWKVTP